MRGRRKLVPKLTLLAIRQSGESALALSRLSIVRQCRLVSISRSSFYYEGKGESLRPKWGDKECLLTELDNQICTLFSNFAVSGSYIGVRPVVLYY